MSINESTTEEMPNTEENKSMTVKTEGIPQDTLQALSMTFDQEENLPENLLIESARHLSNLAHSLYERHEDDYISSKIISHPDSLKIDDICKLADTATKQMAIALQFKKERITAIKTINELKRIV